MFYTPEMFRKIKEDLQKASPNNWRIFGAVGCGRTKKAAKRIAREMTDCNDFPENEFKAIYEMIDRRNDYWPQ